MGIKQLKKIIKTHASKSIQTINVNSLNGKKVAIDSSILLYKFRYTYPSDDFHIIGFKNIVNDLIGNGIIPVFVFDGKPPDAKLDVLKKRGDLRKKKFEKIEILKSQLNNLNKEYLQEYIDDDPESTNEKENRNNLELLKELELLQKNNLIITKEHSNEVIKLLTNLGIAFFQAPGEAEEYCAFLQKNGVTDYVLTEDTDSLTFGATKVLFNATRREYSLISLDLVLSELEMEYYSFIDFCILSGCDYTCTIPKIGPVNALKIIKEYSSIDSFISENTKYSIPSNFDYLTARALFIQNENYKIPELIIPEIKNNYLFIN